MNPRIYKKQAKRAVELLRSHGHDVSGYRPSTDGECIEYPGGWQALFRQAPNVRASWDRMAGVPGQWYRASYEYDEWEFTTARRHWIDVYYDEMIVPPGFWEALSADIDGSILWPSMTLKQTRDRFSTSQIAKGWRWRGGRAVKVEADNRTSSDKQ